MGRVCKCLVDGEEITAVQLAEMTGVCLDTARRRIIDYRAGRLKKESLLHVGLIPKGIRPKHKDGGPTREWKQLSDRNKACETCRGGSWERRHIPDTHRHTGERRGRPRLTTAGYIENSERPAAYSGQYRINL